MVFLDDILTMKNIDYISSGREIGFEREANGKKPHICPSY